MMYSNRSQHSHRLQHRDRSSRQRGTYDDRWEGRREHHGDLPHTFHQKCGGEGQSRNERRSRSREHSNSPKRLYNQASVNREWSRKSPAKRRMSSAEWDSSQNKRQRFMESDDEEYYRYRRELENETNIEPIESFSRSRMTKDFKHTQHEEDFKYRKTSQDSRHRYPPEGLTYRHQLDKSTRRTSSKHCKDAERFRERSWDGLQERKKVHSMKSSGSNVGNQSTAIPEQKKSEKGFQRFLDVLNKGVNVAMLTKMVSQGSTEMDDQPCSPTSFMNSADRLQSPVSTSRQEGSCQNTSNWNESEGPQGLASHQPCPKWRSTCGEKSLQMGDHGRRFFSTDGTSESSMEKITPTPEHQKNHRQMQDVLQAIGMDFGLEELGQMSHRIQERLYGKDGAGEHCRRRGSTERDIRRAFSPRPKSRSSSSRSSLSSSTRENLKKKYEYHGQTDVTDIEQGKVHQAAEFGQNSSSWSRSAADLDKCEIISPKNSLSDKSSTSEMPIYSPVNCSPLPYPALPPSLPPALPTYLSHAGPGLYMPHMSPLVPFPCVPPLNPFPSVLAQARPLSTQHIFNPQPPFFNLTNVKPIQPVYTPPKSRIQSRPRYLQVIDTKHSCTG